MSFRKLVQPSEYEGKLLAGSGIAGGVAAQHSPEFLQGSRLKHPLWIFCPAEFICWMMEMWNIHKDKEERPRASFSFSSNLLNREFTAGESFTSVGNFHCRAAKPLCVNLNLELSLLDIAGLTAVHQSKETLFVL